MEKNTNLCFLFSWNTFSITWVKTWISSLLSIAFLYCPCSMNDWFCYYCTRMVLCYDHVSMFVVWATGLIILFFNFKGYWWCQYHFGRSAKIICNCLLMRCDNSSINFSWPYGDAMAWKCSFQYDHLGKESSCHWWIPLKKELLCRILGCKPK